MARSAIRLEESENKFFHTNYYYMWKKLNTAPYYVSGFGEVPEWINDELLLPSYVNLSKCMNLQYVPSMNIVNKIVQFYNANIKPEIDTYQFLHEDLSEADKNRSASGVKAFDLYSGLYYCYYYAGIDDEKHVYGALLKLSNIDDATVAFLVTGLTSADEFENESLLNLLDQEDPSVDDYKAFKESLPLAKRRTSLYKGVATSIPGMMTIQFQNMEKDGNLLSLRMMLSSAIDDVFIGSMGILTMISGDYNMQILKLAIESANIPELAPLEFDDPELFKLLDIKKTTNEHIHLALKENTKWTDYLLEISE